jgi:hypothetical protein
MHSVILADLGAVLERALTYQDRPWSVGHPGTETAARHMR